MNRKYTISEERILQISNDISEDMCTAKKAELIEVVKYFRDKYDNLWEAAESKRLENLSNLLTTMESLIKPITVGEQNEQGSTGRSGSKVVGEQSRACQGSENHQ